MPRKTNPIGPTGLQVASNVARLRGGMQYKDLAARLAEVGRPLTPVAIRDIENGKRNVSTDDLMALAIVFGVSPLTLLMPGSTSDELTATVTGDGDTERACRGLWIWAYGHRRIDSEMTQPDMYRRLRGHELTSTELEMKDRRASVEDVRYSERAIPGGPLRDYGYGDL